MSQGAADRTSDRPVAAVLAPSPPQTALQWLRLAGNTLNLSTPLGLAVGAIGGARFRRGPRGLILGEGYRFRFPVAGAFTMGNVSTTARDWDSLLAGLPSLLAHEERHAWQYLYCLGLPFYPLYAACMAWSWLRTGDRASSNFFERQAGLALGGYADLPTRSIRAGFRALYVELARLARRPHEI